VSAHAIELPAGRARSLRVTLPDGVAAPSAEVFGALGFLLLGLDGAAAEQVLRTVARLVALEVRGEGTVRAELVAGSEPCASAEAACGAAVSVEENAFGLVDVVDEREDYGVYRLRIAPGKAIPTHEHRRMDEWEYALTGDLALQGEPFPLGEAVRWPARFPHRWENRGDGEAVVLCIDRPRFDAADEIPVDAPVLEKCPLRFRPRFDPPSP
jgi:mannose-6-phosphate isomerase-like protein (cupin superfamily)